MIVSLLGFNDMSGVRITAKHLIYTTSNYGDFKRLTCCGSLILAVS